MKIISKSVKKGRFILNFDDGNQSLPILKSVFLKSGFKIGDNITDDELYALSLTSEQKAAYNRALYYISRSNMSSNYLKKKLDGKFLDEAVDFAIIKVLENGFIDDYDYAQMLAQSLKQKGLSKTDIKNKMFLKGVNKDHINDILDGFIFDEVADITNIINKKYLQKLSLDNGEQKVATALMRRGFSPYNVKKAIEIIKEELWAKLEWYL